MGAIRHAWTLPAILAIGLILGGCGSSPEPLASGTHRVRFQTGRPNYRVEPYQVNGVWYRPKVDYSYDESGTASWYGPGFDGKATADGEIYDMNQMTAAHKTLPLPSVVEVSNLQNGRAVRLRVNDRGPFVGDRLIDVSRRAAQMLGFIGTGVAPVRVRVMREESIQVAQAAMRGEYGPVGPAGTAVAVAAPSPARPQPVQMAAAAPPSPKAAEVIAAPLPPLPAPMPAASPPPAVAAPAPLPPPVTAPPSSAPPPPPPTAVAAQRRPWPTLIASAHAETMRPPAPSRGAGRMFVQAGTFAVPENAQRVRARIAALGSAEIVPASSHGSALYRVRVGPVANEAEARRLLSRVVDHGYPGARVVDE